MSILSNEARVGSWPSCCPRLRRERSDFRGRSSLAHLSRWPWPSRRGDPERCLLQPGAGARAHARRPVRVREVEYASLSQPSRRADGGQGAIRWPRHPIVRSPRAPVSRRSRHADAAGRYLTPAHQLRRYML